MQTSIPNIPLNSQQRRKSASHTLMIGLLDNGLKKWEDLSAVYVTWKNKPLTPAITTSLRLYQSLFDINSGLEIALTQEMGYGIRVCSETLANTRINEIKKPIIAGLYAWREIGKLDYSSIIVADNVEVSLSGPAYFLNHSCNPNCRIINKPFQLGGRKTFGFQILEKTTRSILNKGDWLTIDYGVKYFKNTGLKCLCGSHPCISDNWRPPPRERV